MYESRPKRKEGEPIEALVGEAIELTASRSNGTVAGVVGEPGGGPQGGPTAGADGAVRARNGEGGFTRRLPWEDWERDRLRTAFSAAVAVAAVEALLLIVLLAAIL